MPTIPLPPREAVILAEIKQGQLRSFKHWLDEVSRLMNAISDAGVDALSFSSVEQGKSSSISIESRLACLEAAFLSIPAPMTEEVKALNQRIDSLESLLFAAVQGDEIVKNLTRRLDNIEAFVSDIVQYDGAELQKIKTDLNNLTVMQLSEVIV